MSAGRTLLFFSSGIEKTGDARVRPFLSMLSVVLFATTIHNAEDGTVSRPPKISKVQSDSESARLEFEVRNLDPDVLRPLARFPERLAEVFFVQAASEIKDPDATFRGLPSLIGTYEIDVSRGLIRFRARFPEEAGMTYWVSYRSVGPSVKPIEATFTTPAAKRVAPTTVVTRVSPARDVLPENLLKLYIEFSAPMSFGQAYEHLKLLDSEGKALDLPFLELGEELWDPRRMRFTLLFDPGRIKRGLKPREELGPVLEAGKSYTFVVEPDWNDAKGNPLKTGFRKSFRVGPPDATTPDPASWRFEPPALNSTEPLLIRFPEPLDRAMLGRVLAVVDGADKPLVGKIAIGDEETTWSFAPESPWLPGRYALLVDKSLEDLAGNSIGRPFEVDVFKVEKTSSDGTVRLKFEPISRSSR